MIAPEGDTRPDLSGIILAGGRSSRFGRDKLAEPVGGEPLLWRPLRVLADVCPELIVVVAPDGPDPVLPKDVPATVRIARDPEAFGGPLVGLRAGCALATGRRVIAVAGDQPGIRPDLLRLLADELDAAGGTPVRAAALVDPDGVLRPLPCVVDRARAIGAADALLAGSERRIRALLSALGARAVEAARWRPVDPEAAWTLDIDEPADLGRL